MSTSLSSGFLDNLSAREQLQHCKRIVIKIGTSSLTDKNGSLNVERVAKFSAAIAELSTVHKKDILLVTSGAIGAGVGALGFAKRPKALAQLQMAAAIGQSRLMSVYSESFEKENLLCAQILLTHDDLKNRARHINAVNTFDALLAHKVIPIINENDVVAVDEIRVGDNDTLAAMVAIMSKADLLILLTTSDGLRTSNKSDSPRIPFIETVTPKIINLGQGKTNQFSTGGMQTKLIACRNAAKVGVPSLILDSSDPKTILRAISGEDTGTLIGRPKIKRKMIAKKRYMGFFHEAKGTITLDEGARKNLQKGTSSLLAVGIESISGNFVAGAVVDIKSSSGEELGRGVSAFSSRQLAVMRGKRSAELAKIDQEFADKPVIHKDQMVLL